MDALRIAFYSDTYLPAVDGVVTSMLNFRRELERRGHKVYIYASGDNAAKRRYANRKTFITTGVRLKSYPQYKMAVMPYKSVTRLKDLDVDLIHAHTPFMMGFAGLVAAKLQKYPIVGSFHTIINNKEVIREYYPGGKRFRKFASKYLWEYAKFFYRRCDATTVPSEPIARMLKRGGVGNLTILPNSVDLKAFNPRVGGNGIRRELGIDKGDRMVLCLGRLSREKKLETMLRAAKVVAKKDDQVQFVVGGTGPAAERYRDMARRLGISRNVHFTGFVEQEVLPNLYAASDAFCMPSTFETHGIVALEAMACGKPVVGADFLALKDLIKNGKNGEKFAPGDYIACARKIEKVLNNTESYKQQAVNTAKEFSLENVTDKLLDIYNLVLTEKAMH